MNKRVRGFILVTLALSLGFCLTAQSPTFPLIQGRVLSTGRIVPVQVDANGVVQVNSGGGSGGCSAPCVVIGPDAPGAAPTQDPVQAAGFDGTDVRRILTDSSGRTVVTPQAAVGAAAGNPFPGGFRDDSGNVQANYGFPDQATVTIAAGTDAVIATGAMGKKTYIGTLVFSLDSAQSVTIRQGTTSSTPCDTGTATIIGPLPATTTVALDPNTQGPFHTTTNANDLCIHLGGSATVGGGLTYGQH